jgi:hypothetical protein
MMAHLEVPLTTTRQQKNTTSRRKRAHIVAENEDIYLARDYTKALTQDEELVNAKLCLAPTWSYAGK